jgi:Universal stress protein UspA and related nucleotide-binding proteins
VADVSGPPTALQSAHALAERHGATLEVMACVPPPHDLSILARLSGADPAQVLDQAVERTRATIAAQIQDSAPDRRVALTVAVGKTYLEVVRHVAQSGCDFVVKTAETLSGVDRFLFASTDQHLLRKCPCPVWLQTPTATPLPRRIVAAVDLDMWDAAEPETLTSLNRRVVDAACTIAAAQSAEIVVLHAWDAIGAGMVWAFAGDGDPRLSADRYVNEILDSRQKAMDRFLSQMRSDGAPRPRLVPRLAKVLPKRSSGPKPERCRRTWS